MIHLDDSDESETSKETATSHSSEDEDEWKFEQFEKLRIIFSI